MMEMLDAVETAVNTRTSVCKYLPDKLTDAEIRKVLITGQGAPSGENAQPWRFIIVEDLEKRKKLGNLCRMGSGRYFTAEYVTKKMDHRFEGLKMNRRSRSCS